MVASTVQTKTCSRKPPGNFIGRSNTCKGIPGSPKPAARPTNTKQPSSLHRSVESLIKEDNDLELARLLIGTCHSIKMFRQEEALGNCARIQRVVAKGLESHPDPALFIVRMLIDVGTLVFTRKLDIEFEMAISKLLVDAFSLSEEQQAAQRVEVKAADDTTRPGQKQASYNANIQDTIHVDLIDLAGVNNCKEVTEGAGWDNNHPRATSSRSPNLLDDDGGSGALSLLPLQPCVPSPRTQASLECNGVSADSSATPLATPAYAPPTESLEPLRHASVNHRELRTPTPLDFNISEDDQGSHAGHIAQTASRHIQYRHRVMLLKEIESWKNPIPVYVSIQVFGLEAYLSDTIPKRRIGYPAFSYGASLVLQLSKLDLWEEANALLASLPKSDDVSLQEELLRMLITKKKLGILHDYVSEDLGMCEKALDFIEGILKDRAPTYSGSEGRHIPTAVAVEAEEFGCWGDIANWMVSNEDTLFAAGTGVAGRTTSCETVHLVEMALSLMMRLSVVDPTDRWSWLRFFIRYCQAVTVLEAPLGGANMRQRTGHPPPNSECLVLKNTWSRLSLVTDIIGDDKLLQKEIMVYFVHSKNDWLTAGYIASKYNLQKTFQVLKNERDQAAGNTVPSATLECDGLSDRSSDIASSSSRDTCSDEGRAEVLIDTSSSFGFPAVLGHGIKQSTEGYSPSPKMLAVPTCKFQSKRQDQSCPKHNLEMAPIMTLPAENDVLVLQVSCPSSVGAKSSWETERQEHSGELQHSLRASKLAIPSFGKPAYVATPLYLLPPNTKVVYVNRQSQLSTLKKSLHRSYIVGMDSEWLLSKGRMGSRTALLKLACDFDDTTYLIDCLPCTDIKANDLSILLANFFADRSVRKIAYDWDHGRMRLEGTFPLLQEKWNQLDNFLDLRYVWYHPTIKSIKSNVVDLDKNQPMEQVIAIDRWSTTPNFPEMERTFHGGVSGMLRKFFKRKLNIKLKNSNWEARPVRLEQRLYAAMAARCLLDLYSVLDKSERI